MSPLPGAREFLDELRTRYQLIILSDTFYEFADPLMQQLGRPTLFCHRLLIDEQGFVAGYRLRQPDQKRHAVIALQGLNYRVLAAGDSYNDTAMLTAADAGFLMHAPPKEPEGHRVHQQDAFTGKGQRATLGRHHQQVRQGQRRSFHGYLILRVL